MIVAVSTKNAYARGQRESFYPHVLRGLGDSISSAQQIQLQNDAAGIGASLASAQNNLQDLAEAATNDANVNAKIGAELADAQAQYNSLYQAYETWLNSWSTAILSTLMWPPTLAQDMQFNSQLADLRTRITQMQAEVSASAVATQNTQIQTGLQSTYASLAQSALNSGDQAGYQYYMALASSSAEAAASSAATGAAAAAPTGTAASLAAWFENNWAFVAIAIGVIAIGPALVKKL